VQRRTIDSRGDDRVSGMRLRVQDDTTSRRFRVLRPKDRSMCPRSPFLYRAWSRRRLLVADTGRGRSQGRLDGGVTRCTCLAAGVGRGGQCVGESDLERLRQFDEADCSPSRAQHQFCCRCRKAGSALRRQPAGNENVRRLLLRRTGITRVRSKRVMWAPGGWASALGSVGARRSYCYGGFDFVGAVASIVVQPESLARRSVPAAAALHLHGLSDQLGGCWLVKRDGKGATS